MKPRLISLLFVFFLMVLLMALYEWTKQLLIPSITIWNSHFMTIGFSSLVALLIANFVFNKYEYLLSVQKKGKAEVVKSKSEAEQANKAKSEFLASMSHELRTPLNSILGFSELMRMKAYGEHGHEKYEEYANDIHESSILLISLINDILDLSKVEAGKYVLLEETLDISTIVNTSVKQSSQTARSTKHELIVDILPGIPHLRGDGRALVQVLNNLVSNAIKFTAENGTITTTATLDSAGRIIISVQDTGIGMTEGDVAKALKPFEQVDNLYSSQHKGTGLGLHLCSNFMKLFGGVLEIESKPGVGSKFILRFPSERTIKKSDLICGHSTMVNL